MRYKDIVSRIQGLADDVDSDLAGRGPFQISIVGSSALIYQGAVGDDRATRDIDLVLVPPEILPYLSRYDMNNAADTFLYTLASGWKSRCVDVAIASKNLIVKALSVEDAAIAKLLAGRDIDTSDLKTMRDLGTIDWSSAKSILENPLEVQVGVSDEEWEQIKGRFEDVTGEGISAVQWDDQD